MSKPPVRFQLFICFVNYYELHCIHSRRPHVAVLNGEVESLGNTTATSVKTCSITIAFLLEDKGDHKL